MATGVETNESRFSGLLPSLRNISSDARNLIISIVLISFGTGIVYVILSLYLFAAGYSTITIGIVSSTQYIAAVLTGIPIGILADAYGRKRILAINLVLMGVAGLIWFLTSSIIPILFGVFLYGTANSSSVSPFNALLSEKTTNERGRNDAFAVLGFGSGMAQGFGALAAGSITPIFHNFFGMSSVESYRPLFFLEFLLCAVAVAIVALKVGEGMRKGTDGPKGKQGIAKDTRKKFSPRFSKESKSIVWRLSILGLVGLGGGLIVPLFALWFKLKFGLDVSVIGPLFSLMTFGTSIAGLFTPKIASKRGSVSTIVTTQMSSVAVLTAVPFLASYALAATAMVGRNILMNMSTPIQRSYYMGLFDPKERATAYSIINTFDAIPRAWGPSISGYLFSLGDYNAPFFITSVLYFSAIVSFYFLFRNLKRA